MDRRGGYDWRFVAAYPLPEHPGYVYWVVDDITPRRQMEQMMRAEQERLADLLENAPVGFYSADRPEEHTSELQSLMRTTYDVLCLKKKTTSNSIRTMLIDKREREHRRIRS